MPGGKVHKHIRIGLKALLTIGKPVKAIRVGGISYLVDKGRTGFVVGIGDIDELASKILIILSDDELRSRMGKLAKEKANLKFRSRVVAANVRQVYREVIQTAKLQE